MTSIPVNIRCSFQERGSALTHPRVIGTVLPGPGSLWPVVNMQMQMGQILTYAGAAPAGEQEITTSNIISNAYHR